tara:strand:- start:403 stop:894 length:492 start_codon:yes stop_codon:yes gene_type:complete
MKKIIDFFKKKSLTFDDISEILVNQGPGNFSGLRSSLAVAKGISISKNLKLYGFNTFLWSCAKFFKTQNSIYSILRYKNKYYIKKFNKNLISNLEAKEITVDEIVEKYNNAFKVITRNSAEKFNEKLLKLNNLNIVDLDHNLLELLKLNDLFDKDLIRPLYLS